MVRASTSVTEAGGRRGRRWLDALRRRLRAARDIYEGIFFAPYRAAVYREYVEERDRFLLLVFADMLGAPNPVSFYTLELMPELLEQFHEWHVRMGIPRPEGGFRCC